MADIMAFGFTIGGVILAAIVLSHFGYLSKTNTGTSGSRMSLGTAGVTIPKITTSPPMRTQRYEI